MGVGAELGCCRSARRSAHELTAKQSGARAGSAASAGCFFRGRREEAKPAAVSLVLCFSTSLCGVTQSPRVADGAVVPMADPLEVAGDGVGMQHFYPAFDS